MPAARRARGSCSLENVEIVCRKGTLPHYSPLNLTQQRDPSAHIARILAYRRISGASDIAALPTTSTPTAINIHFRFCIPSPSSACSSSFRRLAAKLSMGSLGTSTPAERRLSTTIDTPHRCCRRHLLQLSTRRLDAEFSCEGCPCLHPAETNHYGLAVSFNFQALVNSPNACLDLRERPTCSITPARPAS